MWIVYIFGILALGTATGAVQHNVHTSNDRILDLGNTRDFGQGHRDTLVLYVFSDSDPEYLTNLYVFLRQGIMQDDTADYIIIVQFSGDSQNAAHLPALPPSARYIYHENQCYDW